MKHNRLITNILLCIVVVPISCRRIRSKRENLYDVVIIGSGVAGLTAGMQAARAQLKTLVIEGPRAGGSLATVPKITNWPGETAISGYQLMQKLHNHAEHFGCAFLEETVKSVDLSHRPFALVTNGDRTIKARSLIIATGAKAKLLKIPGEDKYWGKGVAVCSRCDGPLFEDQHVAVIGGGNTAMHEAVNMLKHTNKITLIVPSPQLGGNEKMRKKVTGHKNIKIIYNTLVQRIMGNQDEVTELQLKNRATGKKTQLPVDGLFVAIGMRPSTDLFKGHLLCDNKGYLIIKDKTRTSKEGVFACGVVCDSCYQQAAPCAGSGCMAAVDAERDLNKTNCPIG